MWYQRRIYFWSAVLIILFLFTRLYKIDSSLHFFNDIGRDFLVLWRWNETGKPPLLGPQTSALPFNQSAIYFYLLYPFYILSGTSFLSSLYAYLFVYLLAFAAGLYFLRHYPRLQKSLVLVFLMLIVHPQYIIQGRFIWNPSLLTPAILAGLYSLLVFLQFKSQKWLLLAFSAFMFALAISLSYSAAPLLIALSLYLLFQGWEKIWRFGVFSAVSLFILNLPTLFFELRHGFLLTNMMFAGDRLVGQGQPFLQRLARLLQFTLETNWIVALIFIAFLLLFVFLSLREKKSPALQQSSILLGLTVLLTIGLPFSIHSHYIFAITSLLFVVISLLEHKYIWSIAIFCYVIWLQAALRFDYFSPARQSYQTLDNCAREFCETYSQSLFVSNQSSHHPYHNAMEWQYLLSRNHCQVREIADGADQASLMALVLDEDQYEHGKTAYHELTLFGESSEQARFSCNEKLEIVVLEKYQK
jgi:hypothetical protein